jgi:hypothetical protein
MKTATTYKEYSDNEQKRQQAISINRKNRLRSLPLVPVPEKLECPKVPIAYTRDGEYIGRLDQLPKDKWDSNWVIKYQKEVW